MNVPIEDVERWRARLRQAAPSTVLREMADAYGVTKSTLGFMVADLYLDVGTPAVQAVWTWDIGRTGRGLSDAELDGLLSSHALP